MRETLNQGLEKLADQAPQHSTVPLRLVRRARIRAVLSLVSVVCVIGVVAYGGFVGLSSLAVLRRHAAAQTGPSGSRATTLPRGNGELAVVVTKGETGSPDIYTLSPDGSNIRRLTHTQVKVNPFNTEPAWSPDGKRIAFSRNLTSIVVMNADGTHQSRLTTNRNGADVYPAWSPDGTRIAFARGDDTTNTTAIYIMNSNGSGLTMLPGSTGGTQPAWSPDGKSIIYVVVESETSSRLAIESAAGGPPTYLPTGPTGGFFPTWSPGGKYIAYSTGAGIWAIRADASSPPAQVARDGTEPTWSPDGRQMAFTSKGRIWIATLPTSMNRVAQRVVELPALGGGLRMGEPAWQAVVAP